MTTNEVGVAAHRGLRPLPVVTSAEMAEIDRRARAEYALPGAVLMENAGANAYAAVRERLWGGSLPGATAMGSVSAGAATAPLVFLAGRGNNGGDALVMARHAHAGSATDVTVVVVNGEPRPGTPAADNLAACRALGMPILAWDEARAAASRALQRAAWIFDGIAGTGLSGELSGAPAEVVGEVNAAPGRVVAIDVPSGLGDGYRGGPLVRAVATVTMGLPKRCLYLPAARTAVGEILVVAVGFPRPLLAGTGACELLTEDLLPGLLPPIPPDAHKGTRGHVAAFAAAPGTTGAAHLATAAAARAGAGLVTLYADPDTYAVVAPAARSSMIRRFDWPAAACARARAAPDLAELLRHHRTLLIGPGWGVHPERRSLLGRLLELATSRDGAEHAAPPAGGGRPARAAGGSPLTGVLDADALTLLAQLAAEEGAPRNLRGNWVLTPHPGEMARLLGTTAAEVVADPAAAAVAAAGRWQATVILKGHVTCIADEADAQLAILDRSNPALATGGAGDVLAGVVAGLLSRGMTPAAAARAAVLIHAEAGARARREWGWFQAEDLLPHIGRAASAR